MLRLKELRTENNLTQRELADKIGSTSKSIWAYENKIAIPPLDILIKLSNFFNCSIDYLVGRSDDLGVISIPLENKEPSLNAKEKELLEIFDSLAVEYQMQILEYARYFAERTNTQKKRSL